jgi:hypothetical protein
MAVGNPVRGDVAAGFRDDRVCHICNMNLSEMFLLAKLPEKRKSFIFDGIFSGRMVLEPLILMIP